MSRDYTYPCRVTAPYRPKSPECRLCSRETSSFCAAQHLAPLLGYLRACVYFHFQFVIMDFNDIKSQVSNLTLYDLKAGFRKAQNGSFGLCLLSSSA